MSTNIIGPHGAGINPSTVRPPDTRSLLEDDTWFTPCVNNDPNTGTKIPSVWLNKVTALFRRAIRGQGVPESELDDDMLLKAIQKADRGIKSIASGQSLYDGIDAGDGKHRLRALRPGANITVTQAEDGAVEIAAAGGAGGGTASVGSGLGVEITAGALADLAYQRLPHGAARAAADSMAWRKGSNGLHEVMTYAEFMALVDARIGELVPPAADRTNVLLSNLSSAAGGLITLGAGAPTYQLPDVNLLDLAHGLTVSLHGVSLSAYGGFTGGGAGWVQLEVSIDGGTTYQSATQFDNRGTIGPMDALGGFSHFMVTSAVGAISSRITIPANANFYSLPGAISGGVLTLPSGQHTVKLRLRYTGATASVLRLHGYRYLSLPWTPAAPVEANVSGGYY